MISRLFFSIFLHAALLLVPVFAGAQEPRQAPAGVGAENAAPQLFSTWPVTRPDGSRWRLAFVESGDYSEYPLTLVQIINGLQRLGWLSLDKPMPEGLGGLELWAWLAQNTSSDYLELLADAGWSPGNFESDKRKSMREAIAGRIRNIGDIDLIIAMGTWAGQDMRAIGPPVPVIVASVSDPIASGVADSVQDSGRDNLHARIEPERYQRQVRLFHEIVPFRTLGIVYEDSEAGRSYAAFDAMQQTSAELGFTLHSCLAPSSDIPLEEAVANAVGCYKKLAEDQVDAIYISIHRGVTSESIHDIAHALVQARIPGFSMAGSEEVEAGILLSLAQADMSYVGLFHAETIARVLNGAQPRQLSQVWIDPPKIALNLATARLIGFDPPVDILLAADEVYQSLP